MKWKSDKKVNAEMEDFFPVDSVDKVISIFKSELKRGNEASLATLSILAGFLEDHFTVSRVTVPSKDDGKENFKQTKNKSSKENYKNMGRIQPSLTRAQLDALVQKFSSVIRGYCDLSLVPETEPEATRAVIHRVSDIVWNTLNEDRNKERSHASNIFSYLTEAKVSCFGLALSVVAGCQILGYKDVHLAMSEDHAWAVYGQKGELSTEITWHERLLTDRRGEQLDTEHCKKSWLYSGGHPVICTRGMEVAAIVTALNPAISSTGISEEIVLLQKNLLWHLYETGHLSRYPMALGSLAELEEHLPSQSSGTAAARKTTPSQLYSRCVSVSEKHYADRHIYPHLFLANHHHREGRSLEALSAWADAAQILRLYSYSKEDEEIYKEFLDINTDVIPGLLKSEEQLLKSGSCLISLVRFCDGLCSWEEGGSTPVLHVGWTKSIVKFLTAFDHTIRSQVKFVPAQPQQQTASHRRKGGDNRGQTVELHSGKMCGLISLLEAEKMNLSALQLQLTAQAQSDSRRKSETSESLGRVKRFKKM